MESTPPNNRNVDASQGSDLWIQTFFKETMLTALLNDIGSLEDRGLDDEHCEYVQRALEKYADATTAVPNVGFFAGKSLSKRIELFAEIYRDWNDVDGFSENEIRQRRSFHRSLRKARQEIADKERKLRFEIVNNYDVAGLKAGYEALQGVITLVPDTFKNVGKALDKYFSRGGTV